MAMTDAEKSIAAGLGWNDILNGAAYGIANAEDGRKVRTAIYAEGLMAQKVVAEATKQAGLAEGYAEAASASAEKNTADILYQANNGFLRKDYFDVFGDINRKRDGTAETRAKVISVRDGTSITLNASATDAYAIGQTFSVPSDGEYTFDFTVASFGNSREDVKSITCRVYNIASTTALKEFSCKSLKRYRFSMNLETEKTYMFGWYVAGGTSPCGAKISDIHVYNSAMPSTAPHLTSEQSAAIIALAKDYKDNVNNFVYNYSANRNNYTDKSTSFSADGHARINCNLFVQNILMGRKPDDYFSAEDYTNAITKAFDYGFYFGFPMRRAYGLAIRDDDGNITGYYGYSGSTTEPYTGSYSYNSHYSSTSEELYQQTFNSFLDANNLAQELFSMGCEISLAEAEPGDLIFFYSIDNTDGGFTDTAFRNISHVAMVYATGSSEKDLEIIESTGTYNTPIIRWSLGFSTSANPKDVAKASFYLNHIAMVARNPIAFCFTGHDVPDAITAV